MQDLNEKQIFTYAHNDTSVPERKSRTAGLNKVRFPDCVKAMRESAFLRSVPVSSDETLNFICTLALAKGAKNILELGTAVGVSGICLLNTCKNAHLTTVERDKNFYAEAENNFKLAGCGDRASLILGDAAETVDNLPENAYDFIFLDCAKVQYIKLLPRLKKLLKPNGILVADDVLLYGWVNGEAETPKKRKMLVEHIREYITAVTEDCQLQTSIVDVGDGLAVSVKK